MDGIRISGTMRCDRDWGHEMTWTQTYAPLFGNLGLSALVGAVFMNTPARLVQAPKTISSHHMGRGVFCQESTPGSAKAVTTDSKELLGTGMAAAWSERLPAVRDTNNTSPWRPEILDLIVMSGFYKKTSSARERRHHSELPRQGQTRKERAIRFAHPGQDCGAVDVSHPGNYT